MTTVNGTDVTTSFASGAPSTETFEAGAIVLLVALLVEVELVRAFTGSARRPALQALWIGVAPLLAAAAVIISTRLVALG